MKQFVSLIRPVNLCIAIVTQALFFKAFIDPTFLFQKSTRQEIYLLVSIMLLTLLAAVCGFVINHYFDTKTDAINLKHQWNINPRILLFVYSTLSILGLGSSYLLAAEYSVLFLWWLYPLTYLLLFLYSYSWQKISTLGNLIVALFSAGVTAVLFMLPSILPSSFDLNPRYSLGILFVVFAFLISWIREIIKDVEDQEGDKADHYKTLVISIGFEKTKAVCIFLSFTLIIVELCTIYALVKFDLSWSLVFGILIIPHSLWFFKRLLRWNEKGNHQSLSRSLKMHMGLGMLFLLFIIVTS